MIELRFHRDLYAVPAVDEAAKVFGPYADIELVRDDAGCLLRVTAKPDSNVQGVDERTLCAELSNFALGMTIEAETAKEEAAR